MGVDNEPAFLTIIETLPGALFFCLQFFIPLLFVVRSLKVSFSKNNMQSLVIATNITILVAGLGVVLLPFIEFFLSYWSGGEYVQYTFVGAYTGPFTMFNWMGLIGSVVIPQIMWLPAFRRSVVSAYAWLGAKWLLATLNFLLLRYLVGISNNVNLFYGESCMAEGFDYLMRQVLIFAITIVLIYFIVKRAHRNVPYLD